MPSLTSFPVFIPKIQGMEHSDGIPTVLSFSGLKMATLHVL